MNKKTIIISICTVGVFTSILIANEHIQKTLANQFIEINSSEITTGYGRRIETPSKPADYKPIPEMLSKQYKAEIEKIITDEYPSVIKNADNCVNQAKKILNKMLNNGYNESDNIYLTDLLETAIPASSLDLYNKLMKVTQEKYLKIQYNPISTDHPNSIYYYLYPYFKDNDINFDKLKEIDNYLNKQCELVNKYMEKVNSLNKGG